MSNNIELSWKDIDKLTNVLCGKIKESKIKYSLIVGLNRGGLIPATLLSHKLGVEQGVFTVKSYEGKEKKKTKCDLYISMLGSIKSGDNLLIVDDLVDSGDSLIETVKSIKKIDSDIKKIDSAVLFYKDGSKAEPTYWADKLDSKSWICFPWETYD